MNQWIAKQVLDSGVYGIVWPHVSTVEEARNAVVACRYPRPKDAPLYEPAGQRGDAPGRRRALLGPHPAGVLPQGGRLAAGAPGRGRRGDHVRGGPGGREPAGHPGAGAGHQRRHHRRGRPLPGSRLPAPVRPPEGRRGDGPGAGDLQEVQRRLRPPARGHEERRAAAGAGVPLADAGDRRGRSRRWSWGGRRPDAPDPAGSAAILGRHPGAARMAALPLSFVAGAADGLSGQDSGGEAAP